MHYLADDLEVRPLSGGRGQGVFARRYYPRGELLAVWGGRILSAAQVAQLSTEAQRWVLQIEDDLFQVSDPDNLSLADYINHSCDPNAGIVGQIVLVAMRPIGAGEEICFDYATTDSTSCVEFECWCGSPRCRGHLRANDWRRPDLRARYGDHFSAYLLRRFAAEDSALRQAQAANDRAGRAARQRRPVLVKAVKAAPVAG